MKKVLSERKKSKDLFTLTSKIQNSDQFWLTNCILDLIRGAKQILSEAHFQQFGSDPTQAREEVMAMERVLLQTIKFDFNIEHPYKYIIQVVRVAKRALKHNRLHSMPSS